MNATIGRIVIYRTDGRNGLSYDLPAIVTCTQETHPGDYPNGKKNPLPVPETGDHVHLTVFVPGGHGTTIGRYPLNHEPASSEEFVGASHMNPGSGTYVELNVPYWLHEYDDPASTEIAPRSWRWPEIKREPESISR